MSHVQTNDEPSIPIAQVVPQKTFSIVSRMWWLAGVCLVLAIGLTWASMDSPGREISIRFDQGHGLAQGDAIRHRGIQIGRVNEVRLLPDLSGIEVIANLEQHANQIARRGSRFWIVHPQVDFGGVRGLDTAIGAKYIRVLPGDGPESEVHFDGTPIAPPDGAEQAGIEVILRGDDRYGLSAGSPVTFRGIEVGRVLTSGLSPNAKHVDTVIQIISPHDRLISKNTKFWKTSGIDIAVSLKGVEFSAQSLATVLRGGVAFATPGPSSARNSKDHLGQPNLSEGHIFELFEKADPQWLDSQAAINVLNQPVPAVLGVQATWNERTFGFNRSRMEQASAIIVENGNQLEVVFPRDLIDLLGSAEEGSFELDLIAAKGQPADDLLSLLPLIETASSTGSVSPLARLRIDSLPAELVATAGARDRTVPSRRLRSPSEPEDCFAMRYAQLTPSPGEQTPTVLLEMIGSQDLTIDGSDWKSTTARLSRELWHGAPVLSAKDENCIGMLVVDDGVVRIATW